MALDQLFAQVPGSQDLYNRSNGVLIMPEVTKAGLIVGGYLLWGGRQALAAMALPMLIPVTKVAIMRAREKKIARRKP